MERTKLVELSVEGAFVHLIPAVENLASWKIPELHNDHLICHSNETLDSKCENDCSSFSCSIKEWNKSQSG
jgi:hypothetical protein